MEWRIFCRWAPRIIAGACVCAIVLVVSYSIGRAIRKTVPVDRAAATETAEQTVMRLAYAKVAGLVAAGDVALLDPATMEPGHVGHFLGRVQVLQVIDEQSFLANCGGHTFRVERIDTSRMADDRVLPVEFCLEWFIVTDAVSYTDVTGGKRTVMSCRRLDLKRIDAEAFRRKSLDAPSGPST